MNNRGFTVIELLVSAAILSIVITGLTIALMQQQRQFKMTQEAVDLDQTARATLDYIATEIRNAVSRQGKTFSLSFVNGGSIPTGCSGVDTTNDGTVNSPPDCLTIYTWDMTRGQNGTNLPSIVGNVAVSSSGPPLVLDLPSEWVTPTLLVSANDLLGFRSRARVCVPSDPTGAVCLTNPELCTECAAILQVSSVNALNQAVINGGSGIIEQNQQSAAFPNLATFNANFFIPIFSLLPSEMTIVRSRTLTVDTTARQFEIVQNNAGAAQPVAGGIDAPGVVDLQFVFNLQDADGGITRVGVPLNDGNREYPDFQSNSGFFGGSIAGREKDIRTVEIYLVVRSRVTPQLISGQEIPVQTIPQIGDVLQRQTVMATTANPNPLLETGFIYRIFSTTVYVRNMAREEFR